MKTTTCLRSLSIHLFFPFVLAFATAALSGCAAAADGSDAEGSTSDVENGEAATLPRREALAHAAEENRHDDAVSHVPQTEPSSGVPSPDGPLPPATPHREQ